MNEIHNKELMKLYDKIDICITPLLEVIRTTENDNKKLELDKIYKHLDSARSGIYDYLVSVVRENENKDIK